MYAYFPKKHRFNVKFLKICFVFKSNSPNFATKSENIDLNPNGKHKIID